MSRLIESFRDIPAKYFDKFPHAHRIFLSLALAMGITIPNQQADSLGSSITNINTSNQSLQADGEYSRIVIPQIEPSIERGNVIGRSSDGEKLFIIGQPSEEDLQLVDAPISQQPDPVPAPAPETTSTGSLSAAPTEVSPNTPISEATVEPNQSIFYELFGRDAEIVNIYDRFILLVPNNLRSNENIRITMTAEASAVNEAMEIFLSEVYRSLIASNASDNNGVSFSTIFDLPVDASIDQVHEKMEQMQILPNVPIRYREDQNGPELIHWGNLNLPLVGVIIPELYAGMHGQPTPSRIITDAYYDNGIPARSAGIDVNPVTGQVIILFYGARYGEDDLSSGLPTAIYTVSSAFSPDGHITPPSRAILMGQEAYPTWAILMGQTLANGEYSHPYFMVTNN